MASRVLQWLHQRSVLVLSLLCAGLIWALLHFFAAPLLSQIEERAGDMVWRLGAERKDERRLIVVDVDERSLREIGPWPWPRATQARLLQQIAAMGARQQIFDIVFTEAQPDDAALVQAVQQHSPVLAQVFALEQGGQPSGGHLAGALDWPVCPAPFGSASGYLANFPAMAASSVGHITPRIASDGFVRQQPAIICFQGKSYPALALAALMHGTAEHSLVLERGSNWLEPAWKLSAAGFALGPIPLDPRGDLRVSWRLHPDSFISLSAADVLAARVPAGLLDSAWVLVGSSAFGLNDAIATPFGGAGAGLQVHAQVITALIDGRTPYTPLGAVPAQLLAAVLGVLLLLLLARAPKPVSGHSQPLGQRFPVVLLPLVAVLYGALLWVAHAVLLSRGAIWLGWMDPVVFVLGAGSAMGILEHAKSRLDRDRLYTHLSSYLPAPVAAALALQPPSSAIKASTNQVSVLFADIRNFSAYCEARPPEEAAAVLHAFFSTATRVVEAHGGVIEAFQGDAVLAVWNGEPAPGASPDGSSSDHAHRALQAAVKLQAAMQGVLPDPAPAGLEPLSLGIGAETGPAMAGSFGLASRRTHMVMGRTVTIASRLVEMTAELAHPILVGEGLAAQLGGAGLESMGTFLLDGMRTPHHIYAYPLHAAQFSAPKGH